MIHSNTSPPAGTGSARRKIAVLGGGVGAMVAAFELTQEPDWSDKYEITVYQLGWRLGGKGASGRERAKGDRILEHGLHIWCGFYDNAFRVMRDCYAAAARPPQVPIRTVEQAFRPVNQAYLTELTDGRPQIWRVDMPANDEVPGRGGVLLSPQDYLVELLEGLCDLVERFPLCHLPLPGGLPHTADGSAGWAARGAAADGRSRPRAQQAARDLVRRMSERLPTGLASGAGPQALRDWATSAAPTATALHAARVLAGALPAAQGAGATAAGVGTAAVALSWPERLGTTAASSLLGVIGWLLDEFLELLAAIYATGPLNPPLTSIHAALEIGSACAKGMLADQLLERGFDSIDDQEWSAWVVRHGAPQRALQTAVGRSFYDFVFGLAGGHTAYKDRRVAAGTGLRAMLRMLFTYKGALFYKMNAGMGDIVFAPMQEALAQRGVKFRYFHRVTRLGLSADGSAVENIAINRQATVKPVAGAPAGSEAVYQPLFTTPDGLPCWPSEPDYDQLVEGEELRRRGIDLESYWPDWAGEDITLQRGRDFDLVVLGISLGALPSVAGDLAAHPRLAPKWQPMFDEIKVVATQAMQFWFDKPLAELGWPDPTGVLTSYFEPMDTWSDMSYLLPRESWPAPGPQQISYFCSPFAPTEPAPPPGPSDYGKRQLAAMRAGVADWIDHRLPQLLPGTEGPDGCFDTSLLYAPGATTRQERIDAQYFRVNVDPPSELYVQSVPGSTRYRLAADASGVDNLFLAGDWLRTGLNAGCVEAATMGGLQAARAISGRDIPVVGERDFAAPDMAAQNAPLPWSLAYAEGDVQAAIVTLALPRTHVERLLPPGLQLLSQDATAPGFHPVGLIFAQQQRVRASFLDVLTMSYNECAIAIPYVQHVGADRAAPPLMVLPALYLDHMLPTLAGRLFYGYHKQLARIAGPAASQEVRRLIDGAPILHAQLLADGPSGAYYDFSQLDTVRRLIDQPIVTADPLRGWLYSFIDYRFEVGELTGLSGQVLAGAAVLGQDHAQVWPIRSLRRSALGGFLFKGSWTITNPFESHELERQLGARARRHRS